MDERNNQIIFLFVSTTLYCSLTLIRHAESFLLIYLAKVKPPNYLPTFTKINPCLPYTLIFLLNNDDVNNANHFMNQLLHHICFRTIMIMGLYKTSHKTGAILLPFIRTKRGML